jgi:hypothetical protein
MRLFNEEKMQQVYDSRCRYVSSVKKKLDQLVRDLWRWKKGAALIRFIDSSERLCSSQRHLARR